MKQKVEQCLKDKYGPDFILENLDGQFEYAPENVGPLLQFIHLKTSMKLHLEKYKLEASMAMMVEFFSSFSIDKKAARHIESRNKMLINSAKLTELFDIFMQIVRDDRLRALHRECKQTNLPTVMLLLAAGADVNAEDDVSICFIVRRSSIVMVLYVHYAL